MLRGLLARQLASQLADRPESLRDDVVRVDRLQVDLAGEQEVRVVERRVGRECPLQREPHGVLHEARLEVCVLDDEELVRALEQLVDGRAHRRLDDLDELLGVDPRLRPDIERPATALVVGRQGDELENALDVALAESRLE